MTSSTEDCLNSDLFDGKALETLIIASVRTLKRGNKKCGREEVSKLVNDTLCNEIWKDLFNETLDSLIENQFIKCNIISNRECLSLPKDSELHHRSIQSTQEDSSVHEHQNFCALSNSETNRKSFPFKEELEAFKAQIISEIKNLIHKEISALKEAITTHSNIDVVSGKAQTEVFYQEQLRFINEELRNKDNLINSLLHQLSKQTECITSLNNRFSNNAIDDNNNNNDNLNRKNNSHSNEYNSNNSNNNNNNNNNSNKNDNYNINSNHHNNISSNYFNNDNNNLSKNSKPTSVSANYGNISDKNSSHHDSSNISNNDGNHNNASSSSFNNCNTSNHSSNISDNDSNNINSDNNCNKNKGNNNKEQNTASPNKHKRNSNSRVKRKTKKPKDNSNSNNGSDNNNNDNNNNNYYNNPPNNENHPRQINNARNTVFILGDSIVKNVNGYLLTKKLRHKKLIKVRSFSGAKVSCMYDHVKPTIREFNPNHIILHVGTNELKSSKTASQISRSVIDLALSLKSEANAVTISLIVPRKDNLNNKAQEVNSRLINMCGERDIAFIDHTDTIDTERHLNESKVHLNKSGTIEFAKNVFEFLLQQD